MDEFIDSPKQPNSFGVWFFSQLSSSNEGCLKKREWQKIHNHICKSNRVYVWMEKCICEYNDTKSVCINDRSFKTNFR